MATVCRHYPYTIDDVGRLTPRQVHILMDSYAAEFQDRLEADRRFQAAVHGVKYGGEEREEIPEKTPGPIDTRAVDAIAADHAKRLEGMRQARND